MKHSICRWSMIAAVVIAAQAGSRASGADAEAERMNESGDSLKTLRAGHPRLVLTDDRLAELKRRHQSDPGLQRVVKHVLAAADKVVDEPPIEYKLRGPRLLHVSRRMMDRMYALCTAYRWTGDRKYFDAAVANLDAACAFKDWHPSHFLDTAEMTHGVAIGYDWLYGDLDEPRRQRIREAIVAKGLGVGLDVPTVAPDVRAGRVKLWWIRSRHNWNQVCHGGLAIGALAVADTDADLARKILTQSVTHMPLALAQYAPDGAWGEGPGYWGYATNYTVYCLAAMETALGSDFGLSDTPGLDAAGDFPLYAAGPTRLYFNYADSGDRRRHTLQPSLLWLGRRYKRPGFIAEEMRSLSTRKANPRHLIWYPDNPGVSPPPRVLDKHFRGEVDVVVMRSSWDDRNALWVAVKAGDNQINHGHLDLGNFELDALGVRWARDLGSDDYNMPGYWQGSKRDGKRWSYYRLNSLSHSVPLLGGASQDPFAEAQVTQFRTSAAEGRAVIDLTEAYAPAATRVVRGVGLLADRKAVLVQDEFDLAKPIDVTWAMTTDAAIEVQGSNALLTLEGKQLAARILQPAGATFSVESAEQAKPQKANEGVSRLLVCLPDRSGSVRIVVLLAPAADIDAAAAKVEMQPLAQW